MNASIEKEGHVVGAASRHSKWPAKKKNNGRFTPQRNSTKQPIALCPVEKMHPIDGSSLPSPPESTC